MEQHALHTILVEGVVFRERERVPIGLTLLANENFHQKIPRFRFLKKTLQRMEQHLFGMEQCVLDSNAGKQLS
jgi:hypothetical protein